MSNVEAPPAGHDSQGEVPSIRWLKKRRLAGEQRERAIRANTASSPEIAGLQLRSEYMERLLRHTFPELELDIDSLRRKAESLTIAEDPAHEPARNSGSESEIETELNIEDESCTIEAATATDTVAHYSGEFSHWNFSMRIKQHVKDWMDPVDPSHVPEYWRVEELHANPSDIAEARACFPPRQIAEFLMHVFFKHAAMDYFYVQYSWLAEKVDRVYENPSALTAKDAGIVAIILNVLAIGTQYVHLESPTDLNNSSSQDTEWEREIGTTFYRQATRLLPEIIHLASLDSVQACLLFGLYALPIDPAGLAYIYLNIAVKLATQNGMHRHVPSHTLAPNLTELRNRVWWSLWKIGIFHGRPISIMSSNIDTDLPSDQAGFSDDEQNFHGSYLLITIKLTNYMADFVTELLLLRKCQRSELSSILSRMVDLTNEMTKWWTTLSIGPLNRRSLHLRLEFCLVRMFIGRPFLFSRAGAPPASSVSPENTQGAKNSTMNSIGRLGSETNTRSSRTLMLADVCVQAALEVMEILSSMPENGIGVAKSSYLEYTSCRISLLALIAYCIQNQTNEHYHTLQKGLGIIREMTSTGNTARYEVLLIETLEKSIQRLHFFQGEMRTRETTRQASTAGYDSFRQWTSGWNTRVTSNQQNDSLAQISRKMDRRGDSSGTEWPTDIEQTGWSPDNTTRGPAFISLDSEATDVIGLQPSTSATFLGLEGLNSSPDFYGHVEQQIMEGFLAVPEYEFNFSNDFNDNQQSG
ncbi:hypothetical protein LTR84_009071 [Exophiala bonariae]|uniref:Xylanolytic transcriptional activator regulatory domain-containing protein n=1 Tax=Exophiala bonariae TaxID=1690606 RepID=A0AAV9MVI7_9EURO|nr:hypothetical protein LTR84_009071 [Exophiala bonariae]